MSFDPKTLLVLLTNLCRDQIYQAGQRYTPGIDPSAPNLRIADLSIAINNIACGDEARARFLSVLNEFTEAWQNAKQHSQRSAEIEQLVVAASASLPVMMNRLRSRDASAADEWTVRLSQIDACLIDDVAYWRAEEAKLGPDDGSYSSARSSVRGNINALNRCARVVRNEAEYAASSSFKLLFDPILLISGEWGTGKTHLLCDVTSERLTREAPTALVLAKNFEGNVLADICARLGEVTSVEDTFAGLEDIGQGLRGRTVFIVDGVNEGRRREWQLAIATLLSLVAKHPNIGLVVTCRTPFEAIAVGKSDLGSFIVFNTTVSTIRNLMRRLPSLNTTSCHCRKFHCWITSSRALSH
ncbi:ATP-binding protein [Chromobacterium vaccinii]|uniref:ATP-binding protein n=1 Tax=Chromobacterium vaccinii TaxID=1108595 RepID=UPI000E171935|nr:ATP-binding protein [Chromobacterium vaccinii]SUX56228.1 Uncharacterised protein [Chromobacterium vaccinii]